MSEPVPTHDRKKMEELFQYTASVQSNLDPMDQIRNGAKIDGALWNGLQNPTRIHKAGFILVGCTFVLMSITLILSFYEEQHDSTVWIEDLIGLAFVALGVSIGANAFRNRKDKRLE